MSIPRKHVQQAPKLFAPTNSASEFLNRADVDPQPRAAGRSANPNLSDPSSDPNFRGERLPQRQRVRERGRLGGRSRRTMRQ